MSNIKYDVKDPWFLLNDKIQIALLYHRHRPSLLKVPITLYMPLVCI